MSELVSGYVSLSLVDISVIKQNMAPNINAGNIKHWRGSSQEALYDQKYTKSWEWLAIFMYAVPSEFILPVSSYC